ncbi:MAG: hypothetical protein WBS19_09925 [Candidatus Korobacteraceae bacterium]
MKWRIALPLPGFVLNPITALIVAGVHIYLSFGHLAKLFEGDVQWTHIWKGFGALAGAYVFAALASRGLARVRPIESGGEESERPSARHGLVHSSAVIREE